MFKHAHLKSTESPLSELLADIERLHPPRCGHRLDADSRRPRQARHPPLCIFVPRFAAAGSWRMWIYWALSASTLATGYGAHIAQPLLRRAVEGHEAMLDEEKQFI
ncbi:hypothetical protein B0H11DRAFT_446826 [Mycena galericulata]|nr:hypothetical protein B0H11DRAFT_446826 [Mycena galericulata]